DKNRVVLAKLSTAGFPGTVITYTLNANGVAGSTFFLDEFDNSTNGRYRRQIAISAHAVQPPPLTLSCPNSSASLNVYYSSALGASGGSSPYTFSIGSGGIPPGTTLDVFNGLIAGIP